MNAASKWAALRRHLEGVSAAVAAEIRSYPASVNHLLEQRRTLSREMARLVAARKDGSSTLEDFVRASPFLDDAAAQALTGGVEAFLLIKDDGAWRIVSQAWDMANESNPIPSYLMPGK
jgi:hypothetical protein